MVANEVDVAHPSTGHAEIRVLRPRRSPSTVAICTVALLITAGAAAEVMASLIGAPFLQSGRGPASEVGAYWNDPQAVLAALVVSMAGFFLLLTGFLPAEDTPMEPGRDDQDQGADSSFGDPAATRST